MNGTQDLAPEGQGEPGKGPYMKRSVAAALAVLAIAAESQPVSAQAPAVCNTFIQIRDDAQQKALAIRTAVQNKAERKDICALVQRYYTAESSVVKFLEENKSWCGIPDQAIKAAKDNHEHTLSFARPPAPKRPPPSRARRRSATPSGRRRRNRRPIPRPAAARFDTLTGNPLAR